jgi:hypothetical protein
MVGSIARNPHTGSRSEILADYLLSGWGTVTPVRRQDDHGIDLHCTLTKSVGKRAVVTDYYSVQVKSGNRPWVFDSPEAVRWLFDYPTPLFLGCVDKKKGVLTIYQTMSRILAAFYDPPSKLKLTPLDEDVGRVAQWAHPEQYSLSKPILRVSVEDFMDDKKLSVYREVMQSWVRLDSLQCDRKRNGILRIETPLEYQTNEVPGGGWIQQGLLRPNAEQLSRAVNTLVDVVDCVGHQLLVHGDKTNALYAALLLRSLRSTRQADLANNPIENQGLVSPFESEVANGLNQAMDARTEPPYIFEGIEKATGALRACPTISKYLGTQSGGTDVPSLRRNQPKLPRKRARRGK